MKSRPRSFLLALGILPPALVALTVSAEARGRALAPATAPIKTTTARILTTPKGRTLYVFAPDPKDKSTCYGECAKFWPPRLVANGVTPPSKVAGVPGTFGVITRTDGKRQLTYDDAPLYTFVEDKKAGDMNGQGLVAAGGYWWIVVAAGK